MFYFHKYKKWLVLATGKYSLCVIRLNFVAKKTCFSGLFKCTHYSNQKITNKKVKSCDMHDLLIDIKNNVRRCKICFFCWLLPILQYVIFFISRKVGSILQLRFRLILCCPTQTLFLTNFNFSVRWQTTNFFNNERTQYLSATETDIPSM